MFISSSKRTKNRLQASCLIQTQMCSIQNMLARADDVPAEINVWFKRHFEFSWLYARPWKNWTTVLLHVPFQRHLPGWWLCFTEAATFCSPTFKLISALSVCQTRSAVSNIHSLQKRFILHICQTTSISFRLNWNNVKSVQLQTDLQLLSDCKWSFSISF